MNVEASGAIGGDVRTGAGCSCALGLNALVLDLVTAGVTCKCTRSLPNKAYSPSSEASRLNGNSSTKHYIVGTRGRPSRCRLYSAGHLSARGYL